MATTWNTYGEAYADPASGLKEKLARLARVTDPIHAEVARLQSEGMTGEQAWAKVLKHVAPR